MHLDWSVFFFLEVYMNKKTFDHLFELKFDAQIMKNFIRDCLN
jgi:hypothetical protein